MKVLKKRRRVLSNRMIDVNQIDLNQAAEKPFPPERRYRIFIRKRAHDDIWKHAQQSIKPGKSGESGESANEVGGVLVGNIYKDRHGPFLEISGAIVGEHTRNEGAQVTFTHETWEQVNRVKDKEYPREKIVGWYHTHPRFGIFLSDKDKFIQNGFFNQPWQTAFVLDPVQQTEGFFFWDQGDPKLIDEYWVEHERRDRSFAERSRSLDDSLKEDTPRSTEVSPGSAVSRAAFALVVAAGFLALILLFGYVYLREVNRAETEKFVLGALEVQQLRLEKTINDLVNLSQSLEQSKQDSKAKEEAVQKRIQEMAQDLAGTHWQTMQLRQRIETQQQSLDLLRKIVNPDKGTPQERSAEQPEAKP